MNQATINQAAVSQTGLNRSATAGLDTTKRVHNLNNQIGAVMATMIGSAIVIVVLQGTKERLLNRCPGKNYDYLEVLPKISGLIFMFAAIFYFYDTWRQKKETPGQKSLSLLLAANFLALVASAIKLEIILETPINQTAAQEATQSPDLENG
ncbi:MAG: hypothetical protein VB078_04620 [Clostridiaceae bacterium]|nr:hypothetical protein [Clostridiaceae bacterium]